MPFAACSPAAPSGPALLSMLSLLMSSAACTEEMEPCSMAYHSITVSKYRPMYPDM